jgi:hypothetical protein
MKLLKVIKWSLFFLLLAIVSVGAAGVWAWNQRNAFIHQQLITQFSRLAPELRLHLDRVDLHSPAVVRLSGVAIHDADRNQTLFRSQHVVLILDDTELLQRQRVVVRSVRIHQPDILAKRAPSGRWNWQEYRYVAPEQNARPLLPDVICDDVRMQVKLEHGASLPPASLLLTSPRLEAIPASSSEYDFAGVVSLSGAGDLSLSGDCSLETGQWQLNGRMLGLKAGSQLTDLAQSAHPQLNHQLRDVDALFDRILPPARVAAASGAGGVLIGTTATAPRFTGELDLNFSVQSGESAGAPEFRLKVDVHDGQITSPAAPLRLTDVDASFFWDNRSVVCEVRQAVIDQASIAAAIQMEFGPQAAPAFAEVHIQDLFVDNRLKPLLPAKMQQVFDHFQPEGLLSLDVQFQQSPSGEWRPLSLVAEASESSVLFHKFKYPVRDISATFRQRESQTEQTVSSDVFVDVSMRGMAGDRRVDGRGVFRNPGPATEMSFELNVSELPIDQVFRAALDSKGRAVLDSLDLTGLATATARCYRPPGLEQPTHMVVTANVSEASMRFAKFPYDITDLSGTLTFDSQNRSWMFENLAGKHGTATLKGSGQYRGLPVPGTLDLQVVTENGQLDADLYHALTPSQRELWQLLRPAGTVNVAAEISWTAVPGQAAVVKLPRVELIDAKLFPEPFPYQMTVRSAELSYDPNDPRFAGVQHCEIRSLEAEHDGVKISANGWAELTPDAFWQLHFNDLRTGLLKPDDELRAALPASWRPALMLMSQEGKVSIDTSQIDFRGRAVGNTPPTAAWDMNLRLHNCRINAGLELLNVTGKVVARGSWDGYELQNKGEINLQRLEVLEMPITNVSGPYVMDNYELLLGNREVFTRSDPLSVSPTSRIQASAYGGRLYVDSVVELGSKQNFRLFTNVDDALLERYSAMHIPDQPDLKGVVDAWLYLKGEGEAMDSVQGRGQLQISPAALYELPVMVQVFSALSKLNFAVPNRNAFDYALLTFDVHDRSFWFNPIDLVGESLALRGRGQVGFGGDVVLDFFSRPPRSRRPSFPLSDLLLSGATQWVGVQVRGTTERPQTMVRSTIKLDESMRQFLSAFQPRPGAPTPGLAVPGVFTLPRFPQARLPASPPTDASRP